VRTDSVKKEEAARARRPRDGMAATAAAVPSPVTKSRRDGMADVV